MFPKLMFGLRHRDMHNFLGLPKHPLIFLVVVYKASFQNDKAVYILFVDTAKELVSTFAMRRLDDSDASKIDIRLTIKGLL